VTPSGTPALRPSIDEGDTHGHPRRSSSSLETKTDASNAASLDLDGGAAGKPGQGSSDEKLLTTGEMARLSNSTLRTVRFYEEEGILRPAKRTEGGHRLFRRTELDRLLFVSDLRTAGLSLDEIKEILELKGSSASGKQAATNAMRIFTARIQELQEKVAVLARLRDELVKTNDIVSACLSCNDHEIFPNACGNCSVMTSQSALPRSTRVVWSVGSMPAKAQSVAAVEEGDPAVASSETRG
jgi:DNA-binding transcriptional MerR regulator